VKIILTSQHLVNSLYTIVTLARYSTNVSIDLLGLLTRLLIYVKVSNIIYKLDLDYSNYYLLLDSNIYLRDTSSDIHLLDILY
jgi:hypothetical protein